MQAPGPPSSRVATSARPWGTRVELCAPDVRNAVDPASVAALAEVFARDEPGTVVLCAQGPVFCAGGDLAVLSQAAAAGDLPDLLARQAAAFADLVEAIVMCPRPVVAALQGPAVGGGVSLALACDVRVATPAARLVLGWGRWGLPPDGGASALLSLAVGASAARSLLVRGADVEPDSRVGGLVFDSVVEAERLEAAAYALAERLTASPGARAAKAVTRPLVLPALRAQLEEEIAALTAASAEPSVARRLAMLYKM